MENIEPSLAMRPVTHPVRVACVWAVLVALGCVLFRWMEPALPLPPTVALEHQPGVRLFYRYECGKCHTLHAVPGALGKIAPALDHIGTEAAGRVPGLDAAGYLHQSLVDPQAYVVEGYMNVMPSFRRLSPAELRELSGFLLQMR